MRSKPQIEQFEAVAAAIFNRLNPNREPAENCQELADDGCTEDDRRRWKTVENSVKKLPQDALNGLRGLLADLTTARQQGYVRGLIFAARRAHRRWQNELARDLLIEAEVTSLEALYASRAEADDIFGCRDLLKNWSPSKEQVWAARRRNRATPAMLLALWDLPKAVQPAAERGEA